jgi:prepilin-type N-terminal cleavage/methylation domain-containing protein
MITRLIVKMLNCFIVKTKESKGFTLVELLVVVAVIGSISAIIAGVVASTLRGTNKTSTVNNVRENGNYAVSQISRTIKYAKTIEGASLDGNPPWECQAMPFPLTPTPTPIRYKAVKTIDFNGVETTFSCNNSADTPSLTIASNNDSLISADTIALPTPVSTFCFFTCVKERITDSPSIGINFTLTSKTVSNLVETQASVRFSNLIKGRN